jgi:hypothetical protein
MSQRTRRRPFVHVAVYGSLGREMWQVNPFTRQ